MKMFRFLTRYVGTYRVKAFYDLDTQDFPTNDIVDTGINESFDDLYIPCKKGMIKHTYEDGMLYWYIDKIKTGHNVINEIDKKYQDLKYEVEETDSDVMVYFNYNDIEKIASIVLPVTSGAKIPPFSPKNLPKVPYEIPENDNDKLNNLIKNMDKVEKMLFVKSAINEFDEIIQIKKGKKFNITEQRRKSKLKPKMFIHKIGLWNEFIEFCKEKIEKST